MKPVITNLTALIAFVFLVLTSCSKEDLPKNPVPPSKPGKPAESGTFRFTVNVDLTGAPYHTSNLQAVVSITNEKNEEVAKEKTLALDLNGTIKTESLQLPTGTYKLTRFRLVYGGVNTHFATPMAGSQKAPLVQKTLPMEFTVSKAESLVPVEVTSVQTSDRPQQFGYPAGSFDNNQSENDPYLKVKLRAAVQIGEVLYDSIPASLRLTTWNRAGEMATTYVSLKAGVNEIRLLKAAAKFQFHVSALGVTKDLTMEREEVEEGVEYTLGGSREAKKLKSEITYKLVNGAYVAQSKTEYLYDRGLLIRVNHLQRDQNNRPYQAGHEQFRYNGNKVEKITRYDKNNVETGFTSFAYDHEGRVVSMIEKEGYQETHAEVRYPAYSNEEVIVHYTYPDQTYSKDYVLTFSGGNIISSMLYVEGRSSASALYDHDLGINPYAHMNWPDLFFTRMSKTNEVMRYQYYQEHSIPATEPYRFAYTYDADGYPTEVITQHKSYPGAHTVFTTKTVYQY